MKTISGSVVSSKPISLSKAASIISSFISVDTGAPGALSVYLQRTSDAFNELVQIHKDLKSGRSSDRKHKKSRLGTVENGNLIDAEENHREDEVAAASERDRTPGLGQEQSFRYSGNSELGSINDEVRKFEKMKKKKKKKKKMKSNVSEYDHEVVERESARDEKEKSKERKKRKKEEAEDGGFDDSEERHRMKKKKRKHGIEH